MSLQTILELAQAKLSVKSGKVGLIMPGGDDNVLKGEPRIVLKALVLCLVDLEVPINPLSKYDLLSYRLKDATEEEVAKYREAETEPRECSTADAVGMIESGAVGCKALDDCIVTSKTGNKVLLRAIKETLGRGKIDGDQLLLGQTATTKVVAKKLKAHFEQGIERAEKGEPSKAQDEAGQEDTKTRSGDQSEAVSDGSCETWINRYIKNDFNKLAKNEEDFYLHAWLETKGVSKSGQKAFFAKVPRSIPVKNWAGKITELLRDEGADIGADEVDTAGLWAIRKYNGQVNVISSGGVKKVCKK